MIMKACHDQYQLALSMAAVAERLVLQQEESTPHAGSLLSFVG